MRAVDGSRSKGAEVCEHGCVERREREEGGDCFGVNLRWWVGGDVEGCGFCGAGWLVSF